MTRLLLLLCALVCSATAGAQDLDDLLKDVRSRDYDRASRAITRSRRTPGGRSVLLAALENRDPHIRIDALRAFDATAVGDRKTIAALVQHLAEHRPVQYFGDLPGALFWGEVAPLRMSSREYSGTSKKRVPPKLEDPERSARFKALQTLAILCDGDAGSLQEAIDDLQEPEGMQVTRYSDARLVWGTCFRRPVGARDPILAGLASDAPSRQATAMAAFFLLQEDVEDAAPHLMALSDSEHAPIRYRALQLLYRIEPEEKLLRELLARRSQDEVFAVRVVALRRHLQLLDGEPEGALELVLEALADENVDLVALGAECAALLDESDPLRVEPVVKPLIKLLTHKEPQLRRRAAWALGELGPAAQQALGALKRRRKDRDESVQEAARQAVEKITG